MNSIHFSRCELTRTIGAMTTEAAMATMATGATMATEAAMETMATGATMATPPQLWFMTLENDGKEAGARANISFDTSTSR